MSAPTGPRLARWLLSRLLPEELRGPVLADLGEDYRRDRERHGRLVAAWRYWRELAAPSLWLLRRECGSRHRLAPLPRSGGTPEPESSGRSAGLWTELRQVGRGLGSSPGFTLAATATLALGIGATTFVFTVFHGVLLQPLPYAESDRIAMIWADLGDGAQSLPAVNPLDYLDYRQWSDAFEEFTLATGREVMLTGSGEPEVVDLGRVAASFFPFLGVEPALGRSFTAEEDVVGGPDVALLSHGLWRRRYGTDPGVVGAELEIEGVRHEIVGVLPADFHLLLPPEAFRLRDADLWVPVQLDPAELPPRNYTGYTVFARLRPGVSFATGQEDMEAIAARLRQNHPVHADANTRLRAVPLREDVVKGVAPALRLLMAAVALMLLVACANVAHLLLVRGASRDRELAVRAALGAGRGRLAVGFVLESLLLGCLGTAGGLGLATAGLELLNGAGLSTVPRLEAARIDASVLAFAAGISLVTIALSSLAPLLRGLRTDPAAVLREEASASTGSRGHRLREGLVVAEVSLSLMLLVGAGLLLRSFVALQGADPGYDADGVLTFRAQLPRAGGAYETPESRVALFEALQERLEALPGVDVASGISQLPLTGSGPLQPFAYDEETARNWESVTADERWVLDGFFQAAGAVLVAGRDFTRADGGDAEPVAIIDESLARTAWPDEPAVGKRLQIQPEGDPDSFVRVVGVVRHLRLHDVAREVLPQIYVPYRQTPVRSLSFVVRSSGDPGALVGPARRTLATLDDRIVLDEARSFHALVDASLERARISLWLMVGFGAVALLLVCVGIYGVVSWTIARRTRELGLRMALGAAPGALRRSVLARGLTLVVPSLLLGSLLALLLARSLQGLLYGITPLDLPTYIAVSLLLLAVTLLACWAPARRATRVDPTEALRTD